MLWAVLVKGDSADIFKNFQSGVGKTLHNPTVATALSPTTAQSRGLLLDSILGSADAAVARGSTAWSSMGADAIKTVPKPALSAWGQGGPFTPRGSNPSVNEIKLLPSKPFAPITTVTSSISPTAPAAFDRTSSWDNLVDIFQPGGKSASAAFSDLLLPGPGMTVTEYMRKYPRATLAQAQQAVADASPGLLKKWGPLAVAGLGATYAAGGFDQQEEEPGKTLEELQEEMGPTGAELYAANPDRYVFRHNMRTRALSLSRDWAHLLGADSACGRLRRGSNLRHVFRRDMAHLRRDMAHLRHNMRTRAHPPVSGGILGTLGRPKEALSLVPERGPLIASQPVSPTGSLS